MKKKVESVFAVKGKEDKDGYRHADNPDFKYHMESVNEATPTGRASVVGLSGNKDLVIPKNQMSKAKGQYKKMINHLKMAGISMTQPGEIDMMVSHMESAYDEMLALWKNVKEVKKESVNEKVIKVSKKDNIPGNPMKMKGEEKIKKLVYSGSVNNKGSYEIKGNKLNVNNIRPRDKGFFVRHFTMGTGFRKANLYYDGVHWQGKKEF